MPKNYLRDNRLLRLLARFAHAWADLLTRYESTYAWLVYNRVQAVFIAAIYTDIATVTNKRVAVLIPVGHLIGGQVGCCNETPSGMNSIRGRRKGNDRGVRRAL